MDLTQTEFEAPIDTISEMVKVLTDNEEDTRDDVKEVPEVQIQETLEDKEKRELGRHLANMRVQALRNEEYFSSSGLSSSAYTTEDDDDVDPETRDSHLGEFAPPSPELTQKIIKQVEAMFSDSFVYRDAFMMKHIKRGAGGFVSLRLITSIRKVKSLTQDYRVVAHALRSSKELEVNEDSTKVRRAKPLPETFDPDVAQAILLTGMPKDGTMHEKVDEAVGLISSLLKVKYPEENRSALSGIPSVRIIKEATHVPTSYKPDYSPLFNFDLGFCILLDFFGFEKLDIVKVRDLLRPSGSPEDAWKAKLVAHILPSIKADPSRKKNRRVKDGDAEKSPRIKSFPPAKASPSFSPRSHNPHTPSSRLEASGGSNNRLNISSPWSSPGSSPRGSPCLKRRGKPGPSPLMGGMNSSGGESPAGSPWMARKSRVQSGLSPACSNHSILRRSVNLDAEGRNTPCLVSLTRQPRGPDEEGKGFQLVRKLS